MRNLPMSAAPSCASTEIEPPSSHTAGLPFYAMPPEPVLQYQHFADDTLGAEWGRWAEEQSYQAARAEWRRECERVRREAREWIREQEGLRKLRLQVWRRSVWLLPLVPAVDVELEALTVG